MKKIITISGESHAFVEVTGEAGDGSIYLAVTAGGESVYTRLTFDEAETIRVAIVEAVKEGKSQQNK